MKRIPLLIVILVSSSLVSIASMGTRASPVAAQDHELQNVSNALASPTSSERFFDAGRRELEHEIQRLYQGSDAQLSDVLEIDPEIFQQQRDWQQQEQLLDGVRALQSGMSIEPLRESVR